jgi:hypothetical protein
VLTNLDGTYILSLGIEAMISRGSCVGISIVGFVIFNLINFIATTNSMIDNLVS